MRDLVGFKTFQTSDYSNSLVSVINGISTFMGYLKTKPFL